MDANETINKPIGLMKWVLYDEYSNMKDGGSSLVQNQMQSAASTQCAFQMSASSKPTSTFHWFAASTAVKPASTGATAMTSETIGSRVSVTSSISAANVVTTTVTAGVGVFTGAILSAGLCITRLTATLMCCADLVCTKGASDTLVVTWTHTYA